MGGNKKDLSSLSSGTGTDTLKDITADVRYVDKMEGNGVIDGKRGSSPSAIDDDVASEYSFTEAESKRVLKIMDSWIMPVLCISYAIQYWDKTLLGQSVLFGLSRDLGLTQVIGHTSDGKEITSSTRYSNVSWVFYLGYLVAAFPMSHLTHRFPTAKVCAATIFVWSIIIMSTAACKTYPQLMANRFCLGVAESCLGPTFTVYVSFWYTRREQELRSSLWFGSAGIGMMLGPLASFGLGHLHGSLGSSWKYIYLTAGAISMLWSLVVLWVLPDDPHRAKWLSESNRTVILNRLKADNSGAVNRKFVWPQFWEAATDYNLWSSAFFLGAGGVPNGAISTFSGLVIHGFGFSPFVSVLLMVPMGAISLTSSLVAGYTSMKRKGWRFRLMVVLYLPCLLGCLIDWLSPRDRKWLLYFGIMILPSMTGPTGLALSGSSINSSGHTKKATVSGATFIGYCIGNIVGPLCFASTPGPKYTGGFVTSVAFLIAMILLALYSHWHLSRENARRDREYGVPDDELGLEDVTDKQNSKFRYNV